MDEGKLRRDLLDELIATMRTERAPAWQDIPVLAAECEDVLERCRFDRDQALAVLRGERELDDDPWPSCPRCGCDTYLRLRGGLEKTLNHATSSAPITMFVCEACQHLVLRGRMTVDDGPWWSDGVRVQPAPATAPPYRDATAKPEPVEAVEPAVDWQDRRVCGDGACVGIIGANGRCNVCGRPVE
jgi:hypothetical protein